MDKTYMYKRGYFITDLDREFKVVCTFQQRSLHARPSLLLNTLSIQNTIERIKESLSLIWLL